MILWSGGGVPKDVVKVIVKDGVTTLNWRVFFNCTALVSVTIPDLVTQMGRSVFFNCTSLKSVTIAESCTWTDKEMYQGCESLKSLTIRYIREMSDITIKDGPGPQLRFKGKT